MKKYLVGLNNKIKGKATKDQMYLYNAGFDTVMLTQEQVAQEVRLGHAIGPSFSIVRNDGVSSVTNRSRGQFYASQVVAIDFDEGPSYDELAENKIIAQYGSFVYTTTSHTPKKPRSRAVFLLSEPEYDATVFEECVTGLLGYYPTADQACSDPARVFYGSVDCEIAWIGNELPHDLFMGLRVEKPVYERPPVTPYDGSRGDFGQYVASALVREIMALSSSSSGSRHHSLLHSATKLGSLAKSDWNTLTLDAVETALLAACVDNGLVGEDGERSVLKTIHDSFDFSEPRPVPESESRIIVPRIEIQPTTIDPVSYMAGYSHGVRDMCDFFGIPYEYAEMNSFGMSSDGGLLMPYSWNGKVTNVEVLSKDGSSVMKDQSKLAVHGRNSSVTQYVFDGIRSASGVYDILDNEIVVASPRSHWAQLAMTDQMAGNVFVTTGQLTGLKNMSVAWIPMDLGKIKDRGEAKRLFDTWTANKIIL
jgi:hypothetical protein